MGPSSLGSINSNSYILLTDDADKKVYSQKVISQTTFENLKAYYNKNTKPLEAVQQRIHDLRRNLQACKQTNRALLSKIKSSRSVFQHHLHTKQEARQAELNELKELQSELKQNPLQEIVIAIPSPFSTLEEFILSTESGFLLILQKNNAESFHIKKALIQAKAISARMCAQSSVTDAIALAKDFSGYLKEWQHQLLHSSKEIRRLIFINFKQLAFKEEFHQFKSFYYEMLLDFSKKEAQHFIDQDKKKAYGCYQSSQIIRKQAIDRLEDDFVHLKESLEEEINAMKQPDLKKLMEEIIKFKEVEFKLLQFIMFFNI
jgi:hypothetical protein